MVTPPPDEVERSLAGAGWRPTQLVLKRLLDLVVASVLAIAATPVIVVLLVCSAACFRAWPLFIQHRIGARAQPLRVPKVRTLPPDFPTYALKHRVRARTDIPPLMRFIRDRHLDELPQLWLVITGKLSLVGPRPKMPDEHEPVDPAYGRLRTQVPQGCTCLWQIGAHRDGLPSDTPAYDLSYIALRSLRLDVWVLWRTFRQVLGVHTPVSITDLPSWATGARVAPRATTVIDLTDPVDASDVTELPEVIDVTDRAVRSATT